MKRVLCSLNMHPLCIDILEREVDVRLITDPSREGLLTVVGDAQGLVVRHSAKVTAEVIAAAESLEVIGRWGVGMDNIDVEAATSMGIPIVYPPGAGAGTVAEHTLALMLALAKKLLAGDRAVREGRFEEAHIDFGHSDIGGKVIGLVGLGHIGRSVARICRNAFDMKVLAYDPYCDPGVAAELGVELRDDLRRMLADSDYVSLHLPLTSETRHLIGPAELAAMKQTAFLINTSRGSTVDEGALIDTLRVGGIAGAGLDVFEKEPPDPNNPLFEMGNVILAPHIAGDTEEAFRRMAPMVAEGVLAVLRGGRPENVFNPQLYG